MIVKENRSWRNNLRIIGLPEKVETNRNLDIILQEIIQENCPDVLEQEEKIDIERIYRTPSTLNPQKTTPRNIIAKFKSFQVKEKILQEARKRQFRYQGAPIKITQDLAASTLKDQKAWNWYSERQESWVYNQGSPTQQNWLYISRGKFGHLTKLMISKNM